MNESMRLQHDEIQIANLIAALAAQPQIPAGLACLYRNYPHDKYLLDLWGTEDFSGKSVEAIAPAGTAINLRDLVDESLIEMANDFLEREDERERHALKYNAAADAANSRQYELDALMAHR